MDKDDEEVTDAQVAEFLDKMATTAREDIIPKMRSSAFCIIPVTDGPDPFLAMQVGLAILLEKPLIVVALADAQVPMRLRQIADAVVAGPGLAHQEVRDALQAAMEDVMRKRKAKQ
jgi:hypothetical protein